MDVKAYSEGELCEKLRLVTLRGSQIQPYLNSYISIERVNPRQLSPCQRYVLMPELKKIENLRWSIMDEYGWDILQLNGYLSVAYSDTQIDILPPVVEEIVTPFGEIKAIINDGMHRVYLAYQMGQPIHVAYVRGVNQSFPYYAYSIPTGFEGVQIREDIPEGFCKKFHVAEQHKKLFRNFNSVFSNVGDSRPYTSK